ncbi:tetratricopeptide repeat protein [Novosphingobium sp. 9]|uniref:tetratricopeptide repeat protein n=1 Tax=Novosphingobium sp. 9 TaxID=2025349 RepID=UPI0021B6C8B7|nr:tetratricopeptide repeat protein [Novosphingobium sp. 9]
MRHTIWKSGVTLALTLALAGSLGTSLACAAETPQQAPPADPAQQAVQRAVSLMFDKKEPEKGIAAIEPQLAAFSKLADAARAKGDGKGSAFCAMSEPEWKLYDDMATREGKLPTILPGYVCQAYFFTAYAQTELGRKTDALVTLEALHALAPYNPQFLVELGYAQRESGDVTAARASYQAAIDASHWLEGGTAEDRQGVTHARAAAWRGLGYILIDQGDLDGAEKAYRESQVDEPDNAITRNELTVIAERRTAASAPAATGVSAGS